MRGSVVEAALLLAAGLVVVEGSPCRPGHTWWSPEKDACLNCTRCDSNEQTPVVVRPCHVHQDTICGQFSDLDIDWSWLRRPNEHRHAKHRKNHERKPDAEPKERRIIWRFSPPSDEELPSDQKSSWSTEVTKAEYDDEDRSEGSYSEYDDSEDLEVQFDSEPLTSDNEFVWDWQTVVLILATFVCLSFFVVFAVYALYHARQWKILKENLEADVEGISAKLNLMMASADANGFVDISASASPGAENQCGKIRCAYLEKLLVGKSKGRQLGPGNVYIQGNNNH